MRRSWRAYVLEVLGRLAFAPVTPGEFPDDVEPGAIEAAAISARAVLDDLKIIVRWNPHRLENPLDAGGERALVLLQVVFAVRASTVRCAAAGRLRIRLARSLHVEPHPPAEDVDFDHQCSVAWPPPVTPPTSPTATRLGNARDGRKAVGAAFAPRTPSPTCVPYGQAHSRPADSLPVRYTRRAPKDRCWPSPRARAVLDGRAIGL